MSDLRAGYDLVAATYAARIAGELAHKPFDRDILARFAAMTAGGRVLDAGCGPGHVAAHLRALGADIAGLDLSPAMIEQARSLHPGIPFTSGSMTELPADGDLAGIVAFYSIIHIPRDAHAAMFANWRAALRPGGHLLVAFHLGEADRHVDELWGHAVSIDFLFFTREEIESRLTESGFALVESHERPPYPEVEAETRRAYILAQLNSTQTP